MSNLRNEHRHAPIAVLAVVAAIFTCVSDVDAARGGGLGGRAGGARATAHGSINHQAAARTGGGQQMRAGGTVSRGQDVRRQDAGRNAGRDASRDIDRDASRDISRDIERDIDRDISRDIDVDVDVHDDWNDWDEHPFATAAAVTAGVAVTSAVIGSIVYSIPPTCVITVINGVTYQQCGSTWYQPRYFGTTVEYVVVSPPH